MWPALLCSLWLLGACQWEPEVGPVEPSLVLEGEHFALQHIPIKRLDYVLVVESYRTQLDSAMDAEDPRHLSDLPRSILEVHSGDLCPIPGQLLNQLTRVDDPATQVVPREWRGVVRVRRDADGDPVEGGSGKPSLEFVDQHCQSQGPQLSTGAYPSTFFHVATATRQLLVNTEKGVLWRLDPWSDVRKRIAKGVEQWQEVVAPPTGDWEPEEQGLLMIQDGELVIRKLDGQAVARFGRGLGSDSRVLQTRYGGLRVAWESNGALFEAVAPELEPVKLAGSEQRRVCETSYEEGKLRFLLPCEERRVNRLDLATGKVEILDEGIVDESTTRDWTFQTRRVRPDDGGDPYEQLWVRPADADEAVPLEPPLTYLRVLDSTTLSGRAPDESFGTWTLDDGFEPKLQGVADVRTYEDTRLTADSEQPVYLWVMHHDVEDGVGELSLVSSMDFRVETIVEGVPVGGFQTLSFPGVLNPALAVLRDIEEDGGVLETRLIPDLIGTKVDEGVVGFVPRANRQEPGLYYTVGPGEREGIWFAPL